MYNHAIGVHAHMPLAATVWEKVRERRYTQSGCDSKIKHPTTRRRPTTEHTSDLSPPKTHRTQHSIDKATYLGSWRTPRCTRCS
jgi:hypothetical protein